MSLNNSDNAINLEAMPDVAGLEDNDEVYDKAHVVK
jgi:hypothetical protein